MPMVLRVQPESHVEEQMTPEEIQPCVELMLPPRVSPDNSDNVSEAGSESSVKSGRSSKENKVSLVHTHYVSVQN